MMSTMPPPRDALLTATQSLAGGSEPQPIQPIALTSGAVLGKYQILRRVAVGGMAEIYLARAVGLEGFEKVVALKRILPEYANDERLIAMFLREARLAATLHHPNIVQVFEVGITAGGYFFTMEYVPGIDVRRLLRSDRDALRQLPLEHAIAIAIGAAAGLHHAHEQRGSDGRALDIVHRDVSPSNLLVSTGGCVKVVDFGIAKAAEGSETRTGTLKGKFSYMSPEQCRSQVLDRRSDVFALGIVLYEMTTGRSLFREANEFLTMTRIVGEDAPRPSASMTGYPAELEQIVVRALERDRERRFQTAQELQLALERFARERRLAISPVSLADYVQRRTEMTPNVEIGAATATIDSARDAATTDVRLPARHVLAPEPAPALTTASTRPKRLLVAGVGVVLATLLTLVLARNDDSPSSRSAAPEAAGTPQPVASPQRVGADAAAQEAGTPKVVAAPETVTDKTSPSLDIAAIFGATASASPSQADQKKHIVDVPLRVGRREREVRGAAKRPLTKVLNAPSSKTSPSKTSPAPVSKPPESTAANELPAAQPTPSAPQTAAPQTTAPQPATAKPATPHPRDLDAWYAK